MISDNFMVVRTQCPMCLKRAGITVEASEYNAWQSGVYIQDAMPMLSAEEREQLISGMCPRCWSEIFGPEDEPMTKENNS